MNLLIVLVVIFIVASFLIKLQMPYLKGWGGEYFAISRLRQLDPNHYKILNNLLLSSSGSLKTTQIDHVVVSNYGIFCIETKAYQRWIFGNANDKYWTQVIYRHKERFYNPLRQNYAHVRAIEELIRFKYPTTQIISLIAFPKADKLKISGTDAVGSGQDILTKIKSYTNVILSDAERDEIHDILMKANILDKETRKLHDQGVRKFKK